MSIIEQLNADFKEAFKTDKNKKNFLGLILSEIQAAKSRPNFKGDETALSIVKKMEKTLKENIDAGVEGAETEMTYLKPYLPELMSKDAIKEVVSGLIANGATNIGQIMGAFNREHKGKADNSVVKDIALAALS